MLKQNKGILGLDTVRIVLVTLLILAVTAIAVFLALVSLQDANIFTDDSFTDIRVNETTTNTVNETGVNFGNSTAPNAVCTIQNVINSTNSIPVPTDNFTQTNCNIVFSGAVHDGGFNDTVWNISSTTTFTQPSKADRETTAIITNITSGTTEFFSNVPTYMVLLGVVVLLLIIAIVLVVVSRFGTPTGSGEL